MREQEKEEPCIHDEAREATEATEVKRVIEWHLDQAKRRMKKVLEEMLYLRAKATAGPQLWDKKMLTHQEEIKQVDKEWKELMEERERLFIQENEWMWREDEETPYPKSLLREEERVERMMSV